MLSTSWSNILHILTLSSCILTCFDGVHHHHYQGRQNHRPKQPCTHRYISHPPSTHSCLYHIFHVRTGMIGCTTGTAHGGGGHLQNMSEYSLTIKLSLDCICMCTVLDQISNNNFDRHARCTQHCEILVCICEIIVHVHEFIKQGMLFL